MELGVILRELLDAVDRREPLASATVVGTHRSVPRRAGTRMLVWADGRISGTIGGGEMEARVVAECLAALADGRTRLLSYDLVDPATGDAGVCGGTAQIYVEPHMPEPTLYVIGCGHVGRAVVSLASWLGFRVVAYDDRPDVLAEVADADVVVGGPLPAALAAAPIDAHTHVVFLTRNAPLDVELLPHVLATPAATIGVMGSARRWRTTADALLAAGIAPDQLARIDSPIGLELGAETPEEIAVSVLGQVIAARRLDRDGAGATTP